MSAGLRRILPAIGALVVMSCTDAMRPKSETVSVAPAATVLEQRIPCVADVRSSSVRCGDALASGDGATRDIILGNQGGFVKLTSSNIQVTGQVFAFDVTLENKLVQAIGTTNGNSIDPAGIKVFFASGPALASGTGTLDFVDPNTGTPMYDGVGTFTNSNQPFYVYHTMLRTGWTSSPRTWRIRFDPTVITFTFTVLVSAPTVYEQGYVTGNPTLLTLAQGETKAVGGTVVTAAGTPVAGRTITYTSSDPTNAPVDASGIVTGGATRGTASITLQSGTAPGLYPTVVNVCPTIPTIVSGAHIAGTLDPATDCFASIPAGGYPVSPTVIADMFRVSLTAGQQVTVSLVSAPSDGLTLVNANGTSETPTFSLSPTINWIVQSTGIYTLEAQGAAYLGTHGYTLDVTVSAPSIVIGSITQAGVPINLSAAAGVFDVSFSVAAAGTLDLFLAPSANCGSSAIAVGDSLVASQVVPANRVVPTVLTVNSTALNTLTKPRFLNGGYCLKTRLTSGAATVLAPTVALTLANSPRYAGVLTYTNTSNGPPFFDSPTSGQRYYQGSLTVEVTPVDYSGATTSIASLTLTLAGANKTLVLSPASGTQTFTGTFGATPATPSASSIYQYFTASALGDALSVTSATNGGGQPVTIAGAVGVVRVDNLSPVAPALLNGGNGLPSSNWVNGSYPFVSTIQAGGAIDPFENVPVWTEPRIRANDASFVALPVGTAVGFTDCSRSGWDLAGSASALPNAPANATPTQYRLRIFQVDVLGNVRCTDMPNPFGVDKESPTLTVNSPPDQTVIVTGTQMTTAFNDSISGFALGKQVSYSAWRNWSTCVYGTLGNDCTIVQGPTINIDDNSAVDAYYLLMAKSIDQAGNPSPIVTRLYLLDTTAPLIQGISVPQNLTGGTGQAFYSTATDNVDLQSSNFNIQYSALTGLSLYYAGENYGPNYDITRVTTASVVAFVPFFIQQIQSTTAAGVPIALTPADSGEAASVSIRAINAANLISPAVNAAIPNINIESRAGFIDGTDFNNFTIQANPQSVNNGSGTTLTSVSIVTNAVLFSPSAQIAPVPFTQVCYYYQQTAAGHAADPTIPTGSYVQIGCIPAPSITDVAAVSRTFTHTLNGWNPPASLGTSGTVNLIAIGLKSNGVGIVTPVSTNITLVQ